MINDRNGYFKKGGCQMNALKKIMCLAAFIFIFSGCASQGNFVQKQTFDSLAQKVESQTIDVDSYKAKVKEVQQLIDELELRMGRKIYEQDSRITKGREAYIKVLIREKEALERILAETKTALEELQQLPSEVEKGLPANK